MSLDRRHRKWRVKDGARPEVMDADSLTKQPLGSVRRFDVNGIKITATHRAPGRYWLHTTAVDSADLAGFPSLEMDRRPGANGGWDHPE